MFFRPKIYLPPLTFPDAERDLLCATYEAASRIVEYGSGGSTLVAAAAGKPILSVESDRKWAANMNAVLARDFSGARAEVIWCDVGPTKKWGTPRGTAAHRQFHLYPLAVWDRPDVGVPDVVLVDGRFRIACFCATVLRMTAPVTLLFDDYVSRPEYAVVEQLVKPHRITGRMAEFRLEPMQVPQDQWTWFIGAFARTR
ncbi:hypothetical protein [Tabrizicola fusiformis]|uniref:hypothetical protein n=1 Tax=Tabrizicola sp. SY72 TaxID=2741673 RepID=UPI0015720B70|nr:hypothetical protein [Tabrizicola sp. SY72]NTT84516.1 hypothetical protein [Tabrizicola sp. SY72]